MFQEFIPDLTSFWQRSWSLPPLLSELLNMQSALFQVGFQAIAEALGVAAVKAAVAITAIIAGGRLVSFKISKTSCILTFNLFESL